MKTRRPEERKIEVLLAALKLSEKYGYNNITRDDIAAAAGCAPRTVGALYGTMPQLRRAIMSAAVASENLRIIAQGITARESKALRASPELRKRALESLL